MAKLYCKIASDIRSEVGVRAAEDIDASILFNWDGSRDDDGNVRMKVNHAGEYVIAEVYVTNAGKRESKLATITFFPGGEVSVDGDKSE